MKRVAIVQRRLPKYRVPFFEQLRMQLSTRGLQLELYVGQGTKAEMLKNDEGSLAWSIRTPAAYLFADKLCWQPIHPHLLSADLLIVTQENKLLQNHLLLLTRRAGKLAFWGHGANLQSSAPNGFRERYKRWSSLRVDWWFAYTELSEKLLQASGVGCEKITVVNNAIDMRDLIRAVETVSPADEHDLRASHGIGEGARVGLFVGSLYKEKRLDFLLEAALRIHDTCPDFALIIVGDGPERQRVQEWCDSYPWITWKGALFGKEKARYLRSASLMLNPGLVGLGILDSFAARLPLITTDCGLHSPEIAYLKNGRNGVITPNDVGEFSNACLRLLTDRAARDALSEQCAASALDYSVEDMAFRFACGVERALKGA